MKGKILRFLRVIQPLHFSRRFTLGPIPPSLKRSLAVAPKAVGPTKPKRRQAVGPRGCLKAFNKGAQRCCKVAKGPPSSSHWAPWKGKKSSTPNPLGPWSWGAGPDETCWKHKHQKQKKMLKLRTSPTNICLGGERPTVIFWDTAPYDVFTVLVSQSFPTSGALQDLVHQEVSC